MGNLTTTLSLASNVYGGGKSQKYTTAHPVVSAFDTTFKINNSDTFKELIEFKPDGTKTYNKFNYLLLANDGNQSAEIQILLREFNTGTDLADTNPESATIDFILHPGRYMMLPTAKMMVYSTDPDSSGGTDVYVAADTSAGNKDGTSPYATAYVVGGPTFIDPSGYFIASQTNGNPVKLTASGGLFDADIEEDFFKNQMMGNTTTGHAEADHIALFGECHADDVGTLQSISAIGSSTDFTNAKITLSSITADKASATDMYLGAYASIARLTGAHTASVTTITFETNAGGSPSSDGQMFKLYDIIRVGNELMQITGGVPHQTTFTVKRGVLGTTAVAHEDHDAIGFHYMNDVLEYLDSGATAATAGCSFMKGVSNIYTNKTGSFSANTFFGLGRSFSFPNGLVPGSVAIKFYSPAKLPVGIRGATSATLTGLAVSTSYEFKITVDGGTQTAIGFTTDAANVTFGNRVAGTGVLKKIQDALDTASIDVLVSLTGGDVVFTGKTRYRGLSSIALAAGTNGSIAELFGTGLFPLTTALRGQSTPQVPIDSDVDNIMFDDGLGRLKRKSGGTGYINYETGAFLLQACPINSHMKIACSFNSALSGAVKSSRSNVVPVIKARSLNAFRDAYVRVVAYDDIIDDDNVELLMTSVEADTAGFRQTTNPAGGEY